MEELRAHPRTSGALILGIAFSMLAAAVVPPSLWEAYLMRTMAEGVQGVPAGVDMGDMNMGLMARITWVTSLFGILIVWPLTVFVSAGIYAALFLFLFGFEGSWKQILSVTAHAFLISAGAALLLIPFRIAAEDPTLILSVGRVIPGLEDGFIARFLNLIDLTGLWSAAVVGAGAAVVDGRRSVGLGVGLALGATLTLYGVIAGVSGLFGG